MQILTPIETRVLGSLIEKDITTPDYYPLSLNALVNACNQKNNREPVMTLDESAVREALEDVVSTLDRLSQREPPLVRALARQPGTKEVRYMHLFSGEPPEHLMQVNAARSPSPAFGDGVSGPDRITALEEEVFRLRTELTQVQQQLAEFRKQFE